MVIGEKASWLETPYFEFRIAGLGFRVPAFAALRRGCILTLPLERRSPDRQVHRNPLSTCRSGDRRSDVAAFGGSVGHAPLRRGEVSFELQILEGVLPDVMLRR